VGRERVISLPRFGRERAGAGAPALAGANQYAGALLLCLAGLTLVRIVALILSGTELFFDEAQYWFWSRELAFGYYSKPPLIAWIIRGASELCGQGEACIRAPSPLIHAATAMVVYAIGRRLYDGRIGFWAGLTYATLPGVSLSSSLISTDAPLLLFVALALWALIELKDGGGWPWALALGGAIGFGLLSKYAMCYFLLGLAAYALWTAKGRALLQNPKLYAALALGAALLAPNILWNAQNRFATFSHTADNANWHGSMFNPDNAADFLVGQLGVFGPVLFVAFVIYCIDWLRSAERRAAAGDAERLLLAFSVPVLALMTVQALLSRAHANWAAFAYIAATVLITAALIRDGWLRLFRASLALHLFAAFLIVAGGLIAGRAALPGGADPYARVLGWKALAEAAAVKAQEGGFRAIATDKRSLAAELLYYLRDRNIDVVAMRDDGPPSDHFEMTRPLTAATPRPVLLVSFSAEGPQGSRPLGTEQIPAGPVKSRLVHFYALDGAAR
jgi:4-amino-4-deoxy-L-arabinose transferase-like glycosyltransferase